jgi:hypothetical protein
VSSIPYEKVGLQAALVYKIDGGLCNIISSLVISKKFTVVNFIPTSPI